MQVTLLGATGKTGKYLIDEALKRGFDVTVFARSNSQFGDDRVKIIRGDLTDITLLRVAIRDSVAVLSALGPTSVRHPQGQPITKAMEAIISAMKLEGVTRLIAISTGTAIDPHDSYDWKIRIPASAIKYLMRTSFDDIVSLADLIRASDIEWTMVRVAFLKDGPASGAINVGLYGSTRHSMTVSRHNVAEFMFDQIEGRAWVRKAPGISARR